MIKFIGAVAIASLALSSALAQSEPEIVVPMSARERMVLLEMCETATWAARRRFDGTCEYFKQKFETAEKSATKAPEPSPEPKKD